MKRALLGTVVIVVMMIASCSGAIVLGNLQSAAASEFCIDQGVVLDLTEAEREEVQAVYDGFNNNQIRLAKRIITGGQDARQRNPLITDFVIKTALAIGYHESGLINVFGGHLDSVNWAQMRPSIGASEGNPYWGTVEELMRLDYSIPRHFQEYDRLGDELSDYSDMMELAIEIQRPDRAAYEARWDSEHTEAVAELLFENLSNPDSTIADDGSVISCVGASVVGDASVIGQYPPSHTDAWGGHFNGRIPSGAMAEVGDGFYARPDAAFLFTLMARAAAADGITLSITDAYRPLEIQVECPKSIGPDGEPKGLYKDGGLCAVPGTSPHGWGAAFDVNTANGAYEWLDDNASDYCFETIPREPWHWQLNMTDCTPSAPSIFVGQPASPTPTPTQTSQSAVSSFELTEGLTTVSYSDGYQSLLTTNPAVVTASVVATSQNSSSKPHSPTFSPSLVNDSFAHAKRNTSFIEAAERRTI